MGVPRSYGFNPTLVRLRPPEGLEADAVAEACFNPTLVRLRLVLFRVTFPARPLFQSHAGSIEAIRTLLRRMARALGFNPTLVRLRRRQILNTQ